MVKSGRVPDCTGTCPPRDGKDLGHCLSSHTDTLEAFPEYWASHLNAEAQLSLLKASLLLVLCAPTNSVCEEAASRPGYLEPPEHLFYISQILCIQINLNHVLMQSYTYVSFPKCKFWIDIFRTGPKQDRKSHYFGKEYVLSILSSVSSLERFLSLT